MKMNNKYLKYFAKYKENDMSFNELCKYMAKEFRVRYITRQPSIRTIGFYSNSKKDVEKIRKLENIIEIECYGKNKN